MEILTFDDDLLGLKDFANRLEKFINIEHDYVEGSLVIALSSKFGSGKTTFLNMWKSYQEDSGQSSSEKPIIISLNAWESDYYGDPLFAIISALGDSIKRKGESAQKLLDAAKNVGWFSAAIGNQLATKITGVDAVAAGELAEKKKAKRNGENQIVKDSFSIYEGRKTAMNALKGAIRDFVEDSKPKVLFLVDELDRCRPDYAISYLETIKHIFDVKGAVFLLAADRHQLENSAKTAFGANLDFDEYYRKFIHREITLPAITDSGYKNLASKYVSYYLEREGLRFCVMQLDNSRTEIITELVGALKLTPRQIQEVFRILGHILETSEKNKGRLVAGYAFGSIAMTAFKVGRPKIYNLLGTQELDPKNAFDFLKNLLGDRHNDWWFLIFLTGGGIKIKQGENTKEIMKQVGLIEDSDDPINLVQMYNAWGGNSHTNCFARIYEKIEQVSQWD